MLQIAFRRMRQRAFEHIKIFRTRMIMLRADCSWCEVRDKDDDLLPLHPLEVSSDQDRSLDLLFLCRWSRAGLGALSIGWLDAKADDRDRGEQCTTEFGIGLHVAPHRFSPSHRAQSHH